jgi:hypothetical protein
MRGILQPMDPELASIATSGAQTIVGLMVTDAWQGAKKLIARIFASRPKQVSDQLMLDLESSRDELINDNENNSEIFKLEGNRWESILRLHLLENPQAVLLIEELLAFGRSQGVADSIDSSTISINATATGNARVYQQGQGVQHNG